MRTVTRQDCYPADSFWMHASFFKITRRQILRQRVILFSEKKNVNLSIKGRTVVIGDYK